MLKALNCPPTEWQAPDVRAFAAQPGAADVIITWAPWPWRNETQDDAQQQTDASIAWAHSIGKQVIVCLPSPSIPPSISEWEAWVAECVQRYATCTLVATNEPMNGGAMTAAQVAELTQMAADIAAQAGHRRLLVGATDTAEQSLAVIETLHGWRPPRLRGWRGTLLRERLAVYYAHHHYNDVTWHAGEPVEVKQIIAALAHPRWHGQRRVWLSEGGYRFSTFAVSGPFGNLPGAPYPADPAWWRYHALEADERKQQAYLPHHYRWCKRSSRVAGWANYEVRDWLWGGWASGLIRAENGPPGQTWAAGPHPIARIWPRL